MTKKLLTIMLITAILIGGLSASGKADANPPILITEVQTGTTDAQGVESPRQEFIELTNVSAAAINMTGWKLEYLSAANNGTGAATLILDNITGQLSSNGHGIWEHEGYYPIAPDSIIGVGDVSSSGLLAKSGGHVRLMNGTTMVDCVAWGSAVTISGCDKVSSVAAPGYTLQRRLINGTYNKADGVANLAPPTPQGNNIYNVSVTAPVIPLPTNPVQTTLQPECDNIQLSEVLANPAGDDTLGEFIELYNPTDISQSLYGCSLKNSAGKQYAFGETAQLAAREYKSFLYSTTGLALGNSGGSVTLTTVSTTTTTTYPAVGDDEAWALLGGVWSITKMPTPNLANILSLGLSSAASTDGAGADNSDAEDCPEGKFRNPLTGRCKNIDQPTTAVACTATQERNPATGRCRNITTTNTSVVCPAGQERNITTNRCRKVASETSSAKTCPKGQERNADTNRCRKIVASTGGKVLGDKISRTYNYLIVAVALSGVVGYGVFEYRYDLLNACSRLKTRIGFKDSPEQE